MSEQPRCKTCRRWGSLEFGSDGGHRICGILSDSEDEAKPDTLIAPNQGMLDIWTGPDFGCVHHQSKEAK